VQTNYFIAFLYYYRIRRFDKILCCRYLLSKHTYIYIYIYIFIYLHVLFRYIRISKSERHFPGENLSPSLSLPLFLSLSLSLSTTAFLATCWAPLISWHMCSILWGFFRFPRPKGFWESRRYHCARRGWTYEDKWLLCWSNRIRHLKLNRKGGLRCKGLEMQVPKG